MNTYKLTVKDKSGDTYQVEISADSADDAERLASWASFEVVSVEIVK